MAHVMRAMALCLCLALRAAPEAALAPPSREYQVKAVFLFNFTQFVEWPSAAFAGKDTPLVVGILGPDPFSAYLDDVVRGEKAEQHPILVRRFKSVGEIKDCHVLFIDGSQPQPQEALAALKTRNILTVGDGDAFSKQGGMIRLATVNGRIRLKINVEAARAADLTISAKLLKLADIVAPGG
jgi:hypothetical protein